ncbi:MAG: response regulator [Desulfobacterales bacterium]|nr:response regulator [Desulfobacterales bacterium]
MPNQKVLVIDDERIVIDSVTKILKEERIDVEATLSGRQGLEMALKKDYDLVLTDLRMPDIGGMRVLRDLKRAKPSLPVVMITGYATVPSAVQAMKLGAAEILEKPFSPDGLVAVVQKALKAHPPETAADSGVIHREEILRMLERAATDQNLVYDLMHCGADALADYEFTNAEKLAILTADIEWIEKHVGELSPVQRKWLEARRNTEIW